MSSITTPTLPIDLIKIPEVLLRGVDPTSEEYQFLVADVKVNGVELPIKVREVVGADGHITYTLVDGRQRLGAAKEAGLNEIPVTVETMTDNEAMLKSIRLNLQRVTMKPASYGKFLKELLVRNQSMTVSSLAAELNYSPQWVQDRLNLTDLIPAAQALVDDGSIVAVNGVALAKLPPEEQEAFLQRAQTLAGLEFAAQVAERVKAVNQAKRAGATPKSETFNAAPVLRTRSALLELLNADASSSLISSILNEAGVAPGDAVGAVQAVAKWAFSLDSATLSQRETEWTAEQNRMKEEAGRKKAEREKAAAEKKAADAIAKTEAAQTKAAMSVLS